MFMGAEGCLVSAKSEQAIDKIISLWEHRYDKDDACCFEDYPSDVFEVMEKVIKVVYYMEVTGEKEEFSIMSLIEMLISLIEKLLRNAFGTSSLF